MSPLSTCAGLFGTGGAETAACEAGELLPCLGDDAARGRLTAPGDASVVAGNAGAALEDIIGNGAVTPDATDATDATARLDIVGG